ncbi:hypothetical protein [Actinokineospora sp.]|uniref:hypothetical protein n=1 Tax=Actinokineospora sp. TaxID=1872133 RepID=UPI004037B385
MSPPLPAALLLPALRSVRRGEIVATTRTGVLHHRSVELPVDAFTALVVARRERLVELADERDPFDGWIPVRLTEIGQLLLRRWTTRTAGPPTPAPEARPPGVAASRRRPTGR